MTEHTPIAVDAQGAGALFGLSDRAWRRMNSAGSCPRPLKLGGCVRWNVVELQAWGVAGCPSRARWEEHRLTKPVPEITKPLQGQRFPDGADGRLSQPCHREEE